MRIPQDVILEHETPVPDSKPVEPSSFEHRNWRFIFDINWSAPAAFAVVSINATTTMTEFFNTFHLYIFAQCSSDYPVVNAYNTNGVSES